MNNIENWENILFKKNLDTTIIHIYFSAPMLKYFYFLLNHILYAKLLYSFFFVNCLLYNFTAGLDWSDWRACRPRDFLVCSIEPDIFCAPPIRVNITCKPGDEERFLQVRKTLHFILFVAFLLI
jgi:hypothetical protein